jgi:hypothetical protein
LSDVTRFFQLLREAYGAAERVDAFEVTPETRGLFRQMMASQNADALRLVAFVGENLESLRTQFASAAERLTDDPR